MEQKCKNCRFWLPQSDSFFNKETGKIEQEEPFFGLCRRYPRSFVGHGVGAAYGEDDAPPKTRKEAIEQANRKSWAYPIMRFAEWCGEWQEIAATPESGDTGD